MAETISEMEKFLLQDSTTDDFLKINHKTVSPETKLTAEQVKHDISFFARVLVNVYSGWPFHDAKLKQNILEQLINIYNNATEITCEELLRKLAPTLANIPDNHIMLLIPGYAMGARTALRKKRTFIGHNIAGNKKFYVESYDDFTIIGIPTLADWSKEEMQDFEKQWRTILPGAKKLVIDLRDNGGGNDTIVTKLANHILGHAYPSAKRLYIRNNQDANTVKNLEKKRFAELINSDSTLDPLLIKDFSNKALPKFDKKNAGFTGPLYILTNRWVSSSAEMFCTQIKNYPNVKFIGTNTNGCEIYGFVANTFLPHSRIKFRIGCAYRELFVDNFELNGYSPDINVPDGTDAFDVAMQQITLNKDKQKY